MSRRVAVLAALTSTAVLLASGCSSPARTPSTASIARTAIEYPEARREDLVEDYHGTPVADPYRWLEDPDSPETRVWIEEQNAITNAYLETIPERTALSKRLTTLWNYERFGLPSKVGERYVYSRNDGLQNQSVLLVADDLDGDPRVLIDPNTLSEDGTVSLAGTFFSEDGALMAYALSDGGSDWRTMRVRDVATGADLDDHLEWIKFSGASWAHDGSGFYYSRYDAPAEGAELQAVNTDQKLYFHRIGTPQSQDELVYERPDQPKWGFGGSVTEDGRYLVIHVSEGTLRKNRIFYKDLRAAGGSVRELIPDPDAAFYFTGSHGPTFWFVTDLDAPKGRVMSLDLRSPDRSNWKAIIPERDERLNGASLLGGRLVCSYLKDARTVVRVHEAGGAHVRDVELPGIGTASGFGGKADENETFYSFTSYTQPGAVFRYDVATGASSVFRSPTLAFDPERFETRQVFFRSKDGTRVPMFVSGPRGFELNGANPTLLYGYGGFDISLTPGFSPARIAWMEQGGLYAVANIRGGGEYGEEWHSAGTKLQKQNVFDDFIGAAEWLIENDYTDRSKLAIQGGSNGGLLVGACITQRPDLFAAAIPAVGVLDMLRFHLFTIGWAWTSDYGSSENRDEFEALFAYSPYHNTKPGTAYPATMITTADHDDRVVPAHSFKFAAALQHAQGGDRPALIRIDVRAGHGAGQPPTLRIQQYADELGFLMRELGCSLRP